MKSISTQNLHLLPTPNKLQKTCLSLAVLDAIICPEKSSRYFRFHTDWNPYSSVFHSYNGIADHMHIFFSDVGIFINGFASESVMNCGKETNRPPLVNSFCNFFSFWEQESETSLHLWEGLTTNLPACFHEFLVNDPVKKIGSTFCIWKENSSENWQMGDVTFPEDDYLDGSEELMMLLDGSPETYLLWASEFYDLPEIPPYYIEYIYLHRIIDYDIVRAINPEFTNWHQLVDELDAMNYPHEL